MWTLIIFLFLVILLIVGIIWEIKNGGYVSMDYVPMTMVIVFLFIIFLSCWLIFQVNSFAFCKKFKDMKIILFEIQKDGSIDSINSPFERAKIKLDIRDQNRGLRLYKILNKYFDWFINDHIEKFEYLK